MEDETRITEKDSVIPILFYDVVIFPNSQVAVHLKTLSKQRIFFMTNTKKSITN